MKISHWSLFYLRATMFSFNGYIMTKGTAADELSSRYKKPVFYDFRVPKLKATP
jgi:hypothetical protein